MIDTGCLLLWALCSGSAHVATPRTLPAPHVFVAAVDREASTLPADEGIVLLVIAPHSPARWARARGLQLGTNYSLRIASITKTFIAAASLRLVEQARWSLDDPIVEYLPATLMDLLRADGYDVQRMTVRMLLNHTSGLFDYAEDPQFRTRISQDPTHVWSREEQVALAMTVGDPLAVPGQLFAYSDTGYILLGAMIERVTGQPMPVAVRELLSFERLGLAHTWFETLEPAPANAPPRARQFIDKLDGSQIHSSADLFGGGGLVSTLDDLSRFFRGLFYGEVVRLDSLATMQAPSQQSLASGRAGYGLGLSTYDFDGLRCYGHGGFWGVLVWHCPDADLTITGFVTNTDYRSKLMAVAGEAASIWKAAP